MARRPKDAPPASWGDRKLAVCIGGPRDGWWFFTADLEIRMRAAERMGAQCWPYEPTVRTRVHPHYAATGKVHVYVEPKVSA